MHHSCPSISAPPVQQRRKLYTPVGVGLTTFHPLLAAAAGYQTLHGLCCCLLLELLLLLILLLRSRACMREPARRMPCTQPAFSGSGGQL